MNRPLMIAIVGAGFCGMVSAIRLLQQKKISGTHITLFERVGHGLGGVAYDIDSERLLLNVPASGMSAFEEEPEDFLNFLRTVSPDAIGGTFAPRRVYGSYLRARLQTAIEARPDVQFEIRAAEILDVRPSSTGGWHVHGESFGTAFELVATAVLLATGPGIPARPRWVTDRMLDSGHYRDAWAQTEALSLDASATIATIGTGLTFVDTVITLRAGGFKGHIVALSRHGALPQIERGPPAIPTPSDIPLALRPGESPIKSIRQLIRVFRQQLTLMRAEGRDFRMLIAAIRPLIPGLWNNLTLNERLRFLRHARHLWDSHRHRVPESVGKHIEADIAAGTLKLIAGRIISAQEHAGALDLVVKPRGHTATTSLRVAQVINCTGAPAGAPLGNPLDALKDRKDIRPDQLGLGVLTDQAGQLLNDRGQPQLGLCYVGPLLRAQDWELTAVPELRRRLPSVVSAICSAIEAHARMA